MAASFAAHELLMQIYDLSARLEAEEFRGERAIRERATAPGSAQSSANLVPPRIAYLAEPFRGPMIRGYVGKPALEDLTWNAFAREDKNLEPKDVKKLYLEMRNAPAAPNQ